VDKINLLSKFVYSENFDNSVKNRFFEVAYSILFLVGRLISLSGVNATTKDSLHGVQRIRGKSDKIAAYSANLPPKNPYRVCMTDSVKDL
jgi:hypothetical protein